MNLDYLINQPGYNEDDIDCVIHVWTTLEVIGGKWKMLILWHVHQSTKRYNELRKLIPDISQKMLSQHLKEMEQDGLVLRTVFPNRPPHVEYAITEYGKSLEPIFDVLYDWGVNHKARSASTQIMT